MNYTLSFYALYKSITSLPVTVLPSFVVLTGRNGSGKTHLLEAIRSGNVKSNLVVNVNTDVLMFDWNNIIPRDTGIFDPHQHQTQRSNWFNAIRSSQDKILPKLQQQAISLGIPPENCSTLSKICKLDIGKLEGLLPDNKTAIQVNQQLRNIMKQLGKQVCSETMANIGDNHMKKLVNEVVNENPELFLETSESRYFGNKKLLWGEVDVFQQAFGKLFSTYRDLIHQNDRLEKYQPGDDSDLKHLNPEEFVNVYGEPPWDFVNNILATCNLDFRVDSPPLHETSSYEPRLKKISSDVDMRFRDLSSGEKVLMSFALCLYNANDFRQEKRFPKLLLLDEVDAPLHPSMVLSLLNTIQTVLIAKKKISVILTTHSPSTVALAPEDSLFEMNPSGPLIEKCSKSKALTILTAGVPTLSVSFDGRRQVFVESKTDAKLYEKLYQTYKGELNSERSLTFIEVGHKDKSGAEANSGCAQVNRIVNSMVEYGNKSVFGLVDWDGKVAGSERIKVLSAEIRDGIESLMLDPVLIAATSIKENLSFSRQKGLISETDSYVSLSSWDASTWQKTVDLVQDMVIGSVRPGSEKLNITYLNGMQLSLRKEFLHMDDHDLENKVMDVFGFMRPKNKHAGGLLNHIHDSILSDYPNLLPKDLIDTFEGILNENI